MVLYIHTPLSLCEGRRRKRGKKEGEDWTNNKKKKNEVEISFVLVNEWCCRNKTKHLTKGNAVNLFIYLYAYYYTQWIWCCRNKTKHLTKGNAVEMFIYLYACYYTQWIWWWSIKTAQYRAWESTHTYTHAHERTRPLLFFEHQNVGYCYSC